MKSFFLLWRVGCWNIHVFGLGTLNIFQNPLQSSSYPPLPIASLIFVFNDLVLTPNACSSDDDRVTGGNNNGNSALN